MKTERKTAHSTAQATIANVPVIAAVEHALFSQGFPSGAREQVTKALIAAASEAGRDVDVEQLSARIAMLRETSEAHVHRPRAVPLGTDPWGDAARAASERAEREAADDFSAGGALNPIDMTDGHGDPVGRAKRREQVETERRKAAARAHEPGGAFAPIDLTTAEGRARNDRRSRGA